MYRSMVGIGLLCGFLIVVVFDLTKPVIERKKAEALQAAIFEVLPEAGSATTYLLEDDGTFEPLTEGADAAPGRAVHAGYAEDGRLVGLAIEAEGMGYQDVIRVLYGYSFDLDAVVGVRVLESRETPGLGTRIETDPSFLENFERLDVRLDAAGESLANPISAVKHGTKEHPWQIDAITGATISSNAMATILDRSASFWVPRIRRRLDDFREETSR